MMPRNRKLSLLAGALAGVLALAGCASVGPTTIQVDRHDYSTAIAESWKEQTLLNIVKLRYMDLPVFVDVSSIVAGYSIEATGNIGGQLSASDAAQRDSLSIGTLGKYTDRPTITYVPMTGEKFLKGLLTPIDPKNIFFLLQSGYAADFILGLTVESINGVRNRSASADVVRPADPAFIRALELLREVQIAGALGMRVEEDKAHGKIAVLFMRGEGLGAGDLEKLREIRSLLRLPESQERFVLSYSPLRGGPGELAVNSRSLLQVMGAFSTYIDASENNPAVALGAVPGIQREGIVQGLESVRIRTGPEKPASAYAAVHYRGQWFWIDDDNWQTKRALTAIVYFFTLTDTGGGAGLPLITIPAQ